MSSDRTRSAILAAAERLYADRGFGDVTLRDIVAEANVNLAAVNYHFGSKVEGGFPQIKVRTSNPSSFAAN